MKVWILAGLAFVASTATPHAQSERFKPLTTLPKRGDIEPLQAHLAEIKKVEPNPSGTKDVPVPLPQKNPRARHR
jgi:hypothetical protein